MVYRVFFRSEIPDIPEKCNTEAEEEDRERQLQSVTLFKQTRQGVQGLKTFAFCIVTVNDEHTKPRVRRKLRG